tara:strand:+ start:369 stop:548 length:180 start_codon:yes stop_codon:yes gene_type:complete
MKINLTLESGLDVEFTPDFELENESDLPEVKWILADPSSKDSSLFDPHIFFLGTSDEDD